MGNGDQEYLKFDRIEPRPVAPGTLEGLRKWMINKNYSPHNVFTTTKTVATIIRRYNVTAPSLELAERIKADMRAKNCSEYTIHNYLYALEYWSRSMGLPLKIPDKPRPNTKMPYSLTKEQVDQLLVACKDIRELAILFTSFNTGLRPSELINLNLEDLDFARHRINLRIEGYNRRLKTNKEGFVTMSNRVEAILMKWIKSRPITAPSNALFITEHGLRFKLGGLEALYMRVARRAEMTVRVFPYSARHSCFTLMAESGYSNSTIQLQSRHKDPRSLDAYLHPGVEELRKRLDDNFPL